MGGWGLGIGGWGLGIGGASASGTPGHYGGYKGAPGCVSAY